MAALRLACMGLAGGLSCLFMLQLDYFQQLDSTLSFWQLVGGAQVERYHLEQMQLLANQA